MKIKISSDSTCDLSAELVERYDVHIVPLSVSKDGVFYRDGLEITPQDIFDHVSSGGGVCSTAAVNMDEYQHIFEGLRRDNDAVIHFTISSELSCCYQNACLAAQEVPGVYVIDAENLSTGIGQLVLEASIMAREGAAPEEIVEKINTMKKKLDVSFVIDTLEYLYKGGRCSSLAALGANLLSLKPCIEVVDGKMRVGKKYRGSLEKCLEKYIRERLADVDSLDLHRIFVTHSNMDQATVDRIQAVVESCAPFEEILQTKAGCTISCHCGPNCLGILFFRK
ncbi:MAG: DegV family protein [Ruminococcaceae bacterium]|jgi:DegV family protein with EDD domain|nr:DegV family protein [Oscillospiraceae bacterium]